MQVARLIFRQTIRQIIRQIFGQIYRLILIVLLRNQKAEIVRSIVRHGTRGVYFPQIPPASGGRLPRPPNHSCPLT